MRAREVLTPWRIRSRARMRAMLRSYTPRAEKPSSTALRPHWGKLRARRGASAQAARGICEVGRAVGEASGYVRALQCRDRRVKEEPVPARPLRFGIKMAQMGGSYAEMREAWLEADRLGFDTAWGHDHLLNQNDIALPEDEGWTILTALLAQSRRIRGGLMVTANTFRHPSLLAKIATTVDRISNGRVEVGLGAGWFEDEHRQYGLVLPPLGERMKRLEEACRILIALWTQPRATFEGVYYQVRDAYHEPKPVQRPHPPLVIGTSGERVGLRIAARHAQTWNMARATPDEFGKKSSLLDAY